MQIAKLMNKTKGIWRVITASSVGTLIEWYDFYIFGSLATVIADQFFPKTNPTAALLSTLATFAAGFIVRPFGALVFGRLGDLIGRKYTFLLTLVLMGGSTFAIGLVPGYETIGFAAPVIVLLLRLLQGLALGGEYGGAATYVAEHAPAHRRGYFTSWIQTTATLGLFVSLGVILLTRHMLDSDQAQSIAKFNSWGWRIPFLVSILLVVVSVYMRLKMKESPLFTQLKQEGKTAANPLKESFGHKTNLKLVLLALFGATMGQGVVWYTGQFYAQSFIENVCKVEFDQSRTLLIWSILFATPFFVVFGSWSDKIGRKWIMLMGMLLAVCTYKPLFRQLLTITDLSSRKEVAAMGEKKSTLLPIGNTGNYLRTVVNKAHYDDGSVLSTTTKDTLYSDPAKTTRKPEIKTAKLMDSSSYWKMVFVVFIMILYVTMVYGPIAAFLVELFPTRIRYTSMSLPYHIGNGVFGGLTPFIATLLATVYTSDKLAGLMYPIIVAAISLVVGALYLTSKKKNVDL
ncbi:Predicted arabinose efflux permease, MFS family [Hydrobacter penzbergensis]|uniref:Predicted arabinose efflux permease, MFS family n=2 Tax=Hydrobacter penzbergensis TaxID=1235997 RepID=A0A8X8LEQ3_9BACT|nr:Predicted arabinose efflux permease, MFS family [Hydrobacter penzbergensis]